MLVLDPVSVGDLHRSLINSRIWPRRASLRDAAPYLVTDKSGGFTARLGKGGNGVMGTTVSLLLVMAAAVSCFGPLMPISPRLCRSFRPSRASVPISRGQHETIHSCALYIINRWGAILVLTATIRTLLPLIQRGRRPQKSAHDLKS
jgi:hypothetical protein